MNSSKFKNTGNFATSASLAGLVIAVHFAGLQLLIVDTAGIVVHVPENEPVRIVEPVPAIPMGSGSVKQIETIVVTAKRL